MQLWFPSTIIGVALTDLRFESIVGVALTRVLMDFRSLALL
jgi:hypothetical protein